MLVELKAKIEALRNVEETFNKAYAKVVELGVKHRNEIRVIDKLFDDYLQVKFYVGNNLELSEEVYNTMESFGFCSEVMITSSDYCIDVMIDI